MLLFNIGVGWLCVCVQIKKQGWAYFRAISDISNRLLVVQIHHIQRSFDRKIGFGVQFFYPAAEIKQVADKRSQGRPDEPTMEEESYWEHALIRTSEVGSISHKDIVGVPSSVLENVCFPPPIHHITRDELHNILGYCAPLIWGAAHFESGVLRTSDLGCCALRKWSAVHL